MKIFSLQQESDFIGLIQLVILNHDERLSEN